MAVKSPPGRAEEMKPELMSPEVMPPMNLNKPIAQPGPMPSPNIGNPATAAPPSIPGRAPPMQEPVGETPRTAPKAAKPSVMAPPVPGRAPPMNPSPVKPNVMPTRSTPPVRPSVMAPQVPGRSPGFQGHTPSVRPPVAQPQIANPAGNRLARPKFNGGYGAQVTPGSFNFRDNLNRGR